MAYSAFYEVDIKAPPASVFAYVADISRHGEWGSADDHMKASPDKPGQPAVGARYYFPLVLAIFKGTVQKNYNGAMSNLKSRMEVQPR